MSRFFPAILNKFSLSRFGLNMAQPLIPFTSAVHEATKKVRPKYVKLSACNLLASIIDFLKNFAPLGHMLIFYAESLSFLVESWNEESLSLLENILIVIKLLISRYVLHNT